MAERRKTCAICLREIASGDDWARKYDLSDAESSRVCWLPANDDCGHRGWDIGQPSTLDEALERLLGVKEQRDRLLEAVKEAAELVEDWGSYASDYFQEKHDLRGDVKRLRAIAGEIEEKGDNDD